jgi:hypothetical protein
MAEQDKTRNEPLAAAVNWQGLATFLGRGVEEVKTLELRAPVQAGEQATVSSQPRSKPESVSP